MPPFRRRKFFDNREDLSINAREPPLAGGKAKSDRQI
jgi:hypothetical protein